MTAVDARLPGGMTIRPFASLDEYEACADFQEEIWGQGFSEKVPPAILMIANRLGGLAAGVFSPDGTLEGFVFGLTGIIDGNLVHWSDMLGVRSGLRDTGLGTRLKGYQRAVLLERGIQEMRWTFDPLQGRNAHVNFAKLGVVSREYVANLYGDTESPLHRIGTDRLIATWEMNSARVLERFNRPVHAGGDVGSLAQAVPVLEAEPRRGGFFPGTPLLHEGSRTVSVSIPESINHLMAHDMDLAVAWRQASREAFVHYMGRGYEVREFLRGQGTSTYLLIRTEAGSTG